LNAQQTELSNLKENIIKYVPHELRTPLVSILGFSNLMLDELDSLSLSDFKYMLQTIKTSGLRLSEWVEKFIFYTEVETNSQSYKNNHQDEKNICELKDVIWEDNFSNNRAWMERKDDIRIELENVLLRMNKGYLEFLIKELIENSAKFSEPGTSIKVTGIINGEYYEIAFYDEGIGFSDTCIEKITAFQQFERENKQQYGNGLGLAIVNKILCASNGEFDLKSKKNKFTTLTVKIPLAC
jgi:two-component system, sensor histidine kinase and response regulator